MSVSGLAEPEQLSAMWVTASVLRLLRVQAVIGRRFSEEDDSPGAPQTIMLSHAYWQRQFGADPAVIGTTLRVNGTQREIIGVQRASLRSRKTRRSTIRSSGREVTRISF